MRTWLGVSPVGVADIMRGLLCVGWSEDGTWGNTHPCVGRCPGSSVEGKAEKGFTARGLSRVRGWRQWPWGGGGPGEVPWEGVR